LKEHPYLIYTVTFYPFNGCSFCRINLFCPLWLQHYLAVGVSSLNHKK